MLEKVLLSTDIGSDVDDALALLAMLNGGVNLRGIYTVNGDVKSRACIAKHIVDLFGKLIDIAVGESNPIGDVKPFYYFEDCYVDGRFIDHGKTRYDIVLNPVETIWIVPDGVEDMARKLSEERYCLFSIGPLTNIARLIERHPDVARKVSRLYVMGCRFSNESSEHNVRHDIPAARAVFDSDLPIVVVPSDLCQRKRIEVSQLDDQLHSPAGRYVKRMVDGFRAIDIASNFVTLKYLILEMGNSEKRVPDLERRVEDLDDQVYGAISPDRYFKQYNDLISHLRDQNLNYRQGEIMARVLEMIKKDKIDLSVADVYVPFIYQNPQSVTTVKARVRISPDGKSVLEKGGNHAIVTDINFERFERYLEDRLR